MDSKILPLIAILVSQIFSNVEAYRLTHIRPRYPHNPFFRRSDDSTDICVCFARAENEDLVPGRLQAEGHNNVQRVVAYFYVDIDTDQITTYIPEKTKQKQFPDLTLSEEDVLKHITETSLFETLIAHIKVDNEHSKPTDNDQGQTYDVENYATVVPPLIATEANIPVNSQEEPGTIESEADNFESSHSGVNTLEPSPILSPSVHHTSTQSATPLYTQEVFVTQNEAVDNKGSEGKTIIFNEIEKSISESQKHESIASPHSSLAHHDNFYAQNPLFYNYPTFEAWYQKQVSKFRISSPEKLLYINNNEFKEALKLTLSRNGIILSSEGFLMGLDGKMMDINKLELRSVWIGERLSVKDLVPGQYTNLGRTPTLQTVLVSLVYPPRILGVIPLGKTYLNHGGQLTNHASHSTVSIKSISHGRNIENSHKNPIESTFMFKSTPHAQLTKSAALGSHYNPILLKPAPNAEEYSRSTVRGKPIDEEDTHIHVLAPVPDGSLEEETQSKDDDQNYQEVVKNSSDNDVINREKVAHRSKDHNEVLKSLIKLLQSQDSESEVDDEDEAPGVRIIGGKAAVSSGSLINNRGRSGFMRG